MGANSWTLTEARARFSELVRQAREGEPQVVTVRGKEAVLVVDTTRFDVTPRSRPQARLAAQGPRTMAEFLEASKRYRGAPLKLKRRPGMRVRDISAISEENDE